MFCSLNAKYVVWLSQPYVMVRQSMSCCSRSISGLPVWFVLACMPLLLSVSACQQTAKTVVLDEDVPVLQRELATREVELMQLRLQLLQQKDEINRLSSSQEQAVQEVVRAKARLRSHAGKAETVANMAEARMMLQSSQEAGPTVAQKPILKRAEQYLVMGETELDKENYEGADYLVGKARELLQPTGSGHEVISSATKETEASFYSPIRMQVLRRSNVREKASLQARVLFRVDAQAQVRANAYKGPWLKIQTDDNRTGWVYYKLLDLVM